MNIKNMWNILIEQAKKFLKQNSWVILIFLLALVFVFQTKSWNIIEILIMFVLYFIANLSFAIMNFYYAKNDSKTGTIFLNVSNVIFFCLTFYAFIKQGQFQYFLPQIAFVLWWIKRNFEDVYNIKVKYINFWLLALINSLVVIYMFYYSIQNNNFVLASMLSLIWLSIVSAFLSLENLKVKYFGFLIWTTILLTGSVLSNYEWFLAKNIIWIQMSYLIFTSMIFIWWLKDFKKFKAM